ncbi:MAG: NIPSNAP family containing protein [Bacteroidetes bacterium]|nr:MAG: NIPSNAP family containing protein [Bacteroidota bacterium]
MKKRNHFIIPAFLIAYLFASITIYAFPKTPSEYYEIRVYHYANADQESGISNYLQNALVPALHRQGILKIGVFKSLANDTLADKTIYVLIPLRSADQKLSINSKLDEDAAYRNAGKDYLDAVFDHPPYTRIESIMLLAFPLAPQMNVPQLKGARSERVYELRSYESATEKLHRNKVQMFNEGGEITLFKRLNFNAVFYASVIYGSKTPNLMYMTTFENKEDREAHWKSFSDSPEWKKLSAEPGYQHNVSKVDITFLRPTDYSDY